MSSRVVINSKAKFTPDKVFRNLPHNITAPEFIQVGCWHLVGGTPSPLTQCPLIPCFLSSRLILGTYSLMCGTEDGRGYRWWLGLLAISQQLDL